MNSLITGIILASSAYITPSYQGDLNAFIRFMWASEHCPGIYINYDKTLEQVADLGGALDWSRERTRDKILVETRIAKFEYQQDREAFCDSARKLYLSYDPAHLRTVGVID